MIEAFIFNKVDENCPICQDKLSEDSCYGCKCSPYASRLICGHYAHVSCQIDYNPDVSRCSVCRKNLFKLAERKKKAREEKEKE